MNKRQDMLINWRCHLSPDQRHRFGAPPGWNCRDVRLFLARLPFDQLEPERAAVLNAVEKHFKLQPDQVEMLITAGRDALKNNAVFRSFLSSLGSPPPHGARVASPAARPQEALAQ